MDAIHIFLFVLLIGLVLFVLYLLSKVITYGSADLFLMNPENYKKNPELKDPVVIILFIVGALFWFLVKF